MNNLMTRLRKAGTITSASLDESSYFVQKDNIPTNIPIINAAFSAKIDGGISTGVTILAGESKTFKTLLGLHCLKAYFDKYPDAVCLFYDSEFGMTNDYLENMGIDPKRVEHIPIVHIEQMKFDMSKRLEAIERGDKVFIFIDSLGNLASKKELDDALEEKSVADMTRAKSIRSFFRIITPQITMKDLPCVVINHTYQTMELYSKAVVGGGTAVMYSANQVFIITKAQEKDKEGNLSGYRFTINIEKSRFVREKSKFAFSVVFGAGIYPYSGLFDLAMEAGYIKEATKGWYNIGQSDKKLRRAEIEEDASFFDDLLEDDGFKEFVTTKYSLQYAKEGSDE